jgi:predicted ATPase
MEGEGPLLLEEPELSLNSGVVRRLPGVMHRLTAKRGRQIIVSTHNHELLTDRGIGPDEVWLLVAGREGTVVRSADSLREVKALLSAGATVADAVLPHAEPANIAQLEWSFA